MSRQRKDVWMRELLGGSDELEGLRHRLVHLSPGGTSDHEIRLDTALGETGGHAADFLTRPSHQRCLRASSSPILG
jgi:hypothetical protein